MPHRKFIQDIRPPAKISTIDFVNERSLSTHDVHEKIGTKAKKSFFWLKLFSGSFAFLVLVFGVFSFTSTSNIYAQAFATFKQGNYHLKIFIRDSQTIEQTVNDWLANQENITISQITAGNYGGDFTVIVNYRTGGIGNVLTRIKIFDSNTLTRGISPENKKSFEEHAQEALSNFISTNSIRSIDIMSGGGPLDVFIVYDAENKQIIPTDSQTVLLPNNEQLSSDQIMPSTASTVIEGVIENVDTSIDIDTNIEINTENSDTEVLPMQIEASRGADTVGVETAPNINDTQVTE